MKRVKTSKKRLGRGYGSGKGGHTSGRGQKGQKSRGKIGILFEGVKVKKSFIKRLPFMRGKAKFHAKNKPLPINLQDISKLPGNVKVVTIDALISAGIVDGRKAKKYGVKILGVGDLKQKLTFELPVSESAALKIKKVGGTVINQIINNHDLKVRGFLAKARRVCSLLRFIGRLRASGFREV